MFRFYCKTSCTRLPCKYYPSSYQKDSRGTAIALLSSRTLFREQLSVCRPLNPEFSHYNYNRTMQVRQETILTKKR